MEEAILADNEKTSLIIMAGALLMLFMSLTLLLFFYFSSRKIVRKELEKKEIELNHSQIVLEAIVAAQENERKRIAQDLHDEISSKLNIISLNCNLLINADLDIKKEAEILEAIVELSANALEQSRIIAHNLFPPVFEQFGLHAAIEELCRDLNALNNVNISYQNQAIFVTDAPERLIHVFRILQELINNSLKHGGATQISILFTNAGEKLACFYKDNGKGFDINENSHPAGLGMRNIYSRINTLQGEFKIESAINNGVNVNFSF